MNRWAWHEKCVQDTQIGRHGINVGVAKVKVGVANVKVGVVKVTW